MTGLYNHETGLVGLAGDTGSRIHALDPRAKLVGFVAVTVVAVSTPVSAWPAYAVCATVLVASAAAARVSPRIVWQRARLVLPLVLFVALFLPFFRKGGATYSLGPLSVSEAGLKVLGAVAAKATIGTVSAVLLGATTTFPDLLRALEAMRAPRLFTLIAAFMYRYVFVIVDEVRRMRAALASRRYRPRHALQAGAMGRVATALFLRTYSRGERVYLAMLARGYAGTMPQLNALSFGRSDALFLAILVGVLVPARVLAEIGP